MMKKRPIRVLLFEDNPGDARLFREFLREDALVQVDLDQVDRLETGLKHLAQGKPDVILVDLGLPDSQGLETLTQVYAQAQDVPIVVLTGLDEGELAVEAVRAGAQDYLVKGEISGGLLVRAIRYAIERKQAEEDTRRRLNELEMLYAASLAVGQSLQPQEIGQKMMAILRERFSDAPYCHPPIPCGESNHRAAGLPAAGSGK